MNTASIRSDLHRLANPEYAAVALRFFKTGPGEYGAGDCFLGVQVAPLRALSRKAGALTPSVLISLLKSCWHEERLLALLNMVSQSLQGGERAQLAMRGLYLRYLRHVNNWDLVDSSAAPLLRPQRGFARAPLLRRLARSPQLWRRRVAVIATFDDIRRGVPALTLELSRLLLRDRHDLMHKACGWMLREIGKRSPPKLRQFLRTNAPRMPRTMLRYAIERLPADERRRILAAPTHALTSHLKRRT